MMAEWVEIPACRILLVPHAEFFSDYQAVNEKGDPMSTVSGVPYRIIRKTDGKVFKPARYRPVGSNRQKEFVLEEI